jgi:hypothetical protein
VKTILKNHHVVTTTIVVVLFVAQQNPPWRGDLVFKKNDGDDFLMLGTNGSVWMRGCGGW